MKYRKSQIIQQEYEKITDTLIVLHGKVGLSVNQDQSEANVTTVLKAGGTAYEEAVEFAHHLYSYESGMSSPQSIRHSPASTPKGSIKLIAEAQAVAMEDNTYVLKLSSKNWLNLKRKLELNN